MDIGRSRRGWCQNQNSQIEVTQCSLGGVRQIFLLRDSEVYPKSRTIEKEGL